MSTNAGFRINEFATRGRCQQSVIRCLRIYRLAKQYAMQVSMVSKESEVRHNGNRLGCVGSYLIAETISAALRSDPSSFLFRSHSDEFPPI